MFRESNEIAYNRSKHATYTNKPKPVLQLISQNAKLDESAKALKQQSTTYNDNYIPPVPLKYDTYYNPNHPGADWSGLVSAKYHQKKHSQDHISQKSGLTANEYGLMSNEETKDWNSKNNNQHIKNASNIVIGGIDCSDRFKTEYQRFDSKEPTTRDQLTFEKRQKAIRMIPDPAQAKSKNNPNLENVYQYNENNSFQNHNIESSDRMNKYENDKIPSTSQYRASAYATKSLISDISSKIFSNLVDKEPSKPTILLESDSSYSKNRVLVTDNYHAFPSGKYILYVYITYYDLNISKS